MYSFITFTVKIKITSVCCWKVTKTNKQKLSQFSTHFRAFWSKTRLSFDWFSRLEFWMLLQQIKSTTILMKWCYEHQKSGWDIWKAYYLKTRIIYSKSTSQNWRFLSLKKSEIIKQNFEILIKQRRPGFEVIFELC